MLSIGVNEVALLWSCTATAWLLSKNTGRVGALARNQTV